MFWFFGHKTCGILAPWPGIEPAPPALEGEALTTEPSGKSCQMFSMYILSNMTCDWTELNWIDNIQEHCIYYHTIILRKLLVATDGTLMALQMVHSHSPHWPYQGSSGLIRLLPCSPHLSSSCQPAGGCPGKSQGTQNFPWCPASSVRTPKVGVPEPTAPSTQGSGLWFYSTFTASLWIRSFLYSFLFFWSFLLSFFFFLSKIVHCCHKLRITWILTGTLYCLEITLCRPFHSWLPFGLIIF